jgi:hypothetical protein
MIDIIGAVQGLMVLAGEAPTATPGWDTFAQYGVLGVAVLALGWFVHKVLNQMWARNAEELAREVARGDRLENELRQQNAAIQDKVMPTLFAAANAMTECTEIIREQQHERDHSHRPRNGDPR